VRPPRLSSAVARTWQDAPATTDQVSATGDGNKRYVEVATFDIGTSGASTIEVASEGSLVAVAPALSTAAKGLARFVAIIVGGLMAVPGVILIIVGAVQRSSSRKEQQAALGGPAAANPSRLLVRRQWRRGPDSSGRIRAFDAGGAAGSNPGPLRCEKRICIGGHSRTTPSSQMALMSCIDSRPRPTTTVRPSGTHPPSASRASQALEGAGE
jgi:hypothetical protein